MHTTRAVLFDLDDTLYDHLACSRAGAQAWRERCPALGAATLDQVERANRAALEEVHVRVLAGEVTLAEGRNARTRAVFSRFGASIDEREASEAYVCYRAAYDAVEGPVPGCLEVVAALRAVEGLRLGIVTNNLARNQWAKLDLFGLRNTFDAVVISEDVGVTKPEPRIFEIALERLGVRADETVMVGDSLDRDVVAAEAVGIRAVWLDRRGEATDRDRETRPVLRGWTPPDAAVRTLLGNARSGDTPN